MTTTVSQTSGSQMGVRVSCRVGEGFPGTSLYDYYAATIMKRNQNKNHMNQTTRAFQIISCLPSHSKLIEQTTF